MIHLGLVFARKFSRLVKVRYYISAVSYSCHRPQEIVTPDMEFITYFTRSEIISLSSAIGTLSAVIFAKWLAKSRESTKLRVSAGNRLMVIGSRSTECFEVDNTQTGWRTVTINQTTLHAKNRGKLIPI